MQIGAGCGYSDHDDGAYLHFDGDSGYSNPDAWEFGHFVLDYVYLDRDAVGHGHFAGENGGLNRGDEASLRSGEQNVCSGSDA